MSKVVIAINNPQGHSTVGDSRDAFSRGLGPVSATGAVAETKLDVLLQVGPGMPPYALPQGDVRTVKPYEVGGATWLMVAQPASAPQIAFHRSPALTLNTVLTGVATLVLEETEVALRAGDIAVVLPGVTRSWRPGPDGYTLSVVFLASAKGEAH